MTDNLFLNFSEINEILEAALSNTYSYLRSFRNDAGYSQKLETAFGTGFDQAKANSFFDSFAEEDFSDIPSIEIVNSSDINGANGAFSITTGKIYLAADFISQNAQNIGAVVSVLLEEIGHSIDAQINVADAAGDEGDILARLVLGGILTESELADLQAEDDTATVTLDGEVIEIEQNNPILRVTTNNDSGAGSLRQAIINARNTPGVDTIDLTGVSGTIFLNSSLGSLDPNNDINFVDDGNTTISGQNSHQIITVNGANVTFSRLTFANGLARGGDGNNNGGGGGLGAGGALFIRAGNVTLNNITFSSNRAVGGNGGAAGVSSGQNSYNSQNTDGVAGGQGGKLNSGTSGSDGAGGSGGSKGDANNYNGSNGSDGGAGNFGNGGGGGGGGGGDYGWVWADQGGNGGNGGVGGFGGGGGGGGGGGADYDRDSANDNGNGGKGGEGGQFGGKGSDGVGGLAVGNTSSEASQENRLSGRGGGGAGLGGAIFVNSGASLTLLNSVFTSNSATGGTGANNGQGLGANIFVRDGATAQAIGTNYSNTYGTIKTLPFPNVFYQFNGSIYRLSSTSGTWEQTQAQAQSLGGNLVTINSQAEQDWLVNTFGRSEHLWIGLTDKDIEANTDGTKFKWVSGETSTYRNFFTNEPNNWGGDEDYVGMNFGDAGKWNDYNRTYSSRGIIENKFYEWNGSKYLLTGSGTWEQAQAQAQSLGGNLVTINSQAEQDWLVNTFGGSEQLWIGLTDKVTEAFTDGTKFTWVSGETSTYRNFFTNEPNNWGGDEDYVGMNFGAAGKWNDYPSNFSSRGIIEIKEYNATGNNTDSQFFVLEKPKNYDINVIGGFGPDIFQLRSYDGLTTSQKVYGSQGSDIFNISIEESSGTVGLDFNVGKLKQLAELLVEPDWDVREKRYAADISAAQIAYGIDYAAAVAGVFASLDPTGISGGIVDGIAATAQYANEIANIERNRNLDIEEYQNSLAAIGNFFEGQGSNGWGTVNITQKRSLVEIMDFQPGIDTITLPKLTGNQSYRYTFVSGINGTGVEVAYNNQTNEPSTFLRIYIDPNLLPLINGQNIGLTEFIGSLFTNNATHGVIGQTRNNTSKVAVSGASYTGTIAGDYIYVAQNNPTVGAVKIYGLAGDDLLAGRNNGTNEIYAGEGNDFIVPGGINDFIDGGTGYDQVNYSQNLAGISLTISNSQNVRNVESVIGTIYGDSISFNNLELPPEDGSALNIQGRGGNDNLVGSNYRDVLLGEDGNDSLSGLGGNDTLVGGASKDILTGGAGADLFDYRNLTDSLLNSFDVITDFSAIEDKFLVSTARAGSLFNAGSVATLDATGIAARLTSTNFAVNFAAQFTFGSRTFVAINDATAGFNANTDAIVEVTGLTGTLGTSNFTTVV